MVATLPFFSCGSEVGTEGESETGDAQFSQVCSLFCPHAQACDPEDFDADYTSTQDCEDQCIAELEGWLEAAGAECSDLNLAVVECEIENGFCSFMDVGHTEACGPAQAALNDACGF